MSLLVERVEENILSRHLLSGDERFVVGVSGGLDSMVLLHVLAALAPKHGWKITVAHFNHQLRGRSSDADERFVRATAKQLRFSFEVDSAPVAKIAKEQGISIEMAARQLRHQFFARAAKRHKCKKILLAHHADDQVELFFLRLLRGAGTEGLAGMKWVGLSPVTGALRVVRPLLNQQKEALAEYAVFEKVRFREDASNATVDFQRNQVRHQLLPPLKELQPGITSTILRSMQIVSAESDFVLETARNWLASRGSEFSALNAAVQRRVVELQLREREIVSNFDLIERLRCKTDEPVEFAPGKCVFRNSDGCLKIKNSSFAQFEAGEQVVEVRKGSAEIGRLRFSWRISSGQGLKRPKQDNVEVFDAQAIGDWITLRFWRPGDRFQPIGMKNAVKLQDLFVNAKVPREERHRKVVAVSENGEIFWVEGLRISERFKLQPSTILRLNWSWKIR